MVADAVHSMFDSSSSAIGIYGNKISAKPPDLEHPYGHIKFEYAVALAITFMMLVAAFNIIREAFERVLSGIIPNITFYSFLAITASLIVSLYTSIYERKIGKKTFSPILMADSSHTLTDVFASAVVIAGFVSIKIGFVYADPIAAILVCGFIAYVGISLFKKTTSVLVDRGIPKDVISHIKKITEEMGKDVECHSVRGRVVGEKMFVDMHVTVMGNLSIEEGHRITETLEEKLKKEIKGIQEVIIHIEPIEGRRES